VSDEAYEELLCRAGRDSQSPELVASSILSGLLPDPLLRLMGTITSPVSDVAARHDEYIGEGIYSEMVRSADRQGRQPERAAAEISADTLNDPVMRLAGCLSIPHADIALRHDEYILTRLLPQQDED
jgi:hypothetical protein